jgi:hypothetical protein
MFYDGYVIAVSSAPGYVWGCTNISLMVLHKAYEALGMFKVGRFSFSLLAFRVPQAYITYLFESPLVRRLTKVLIT